ncbi:MAG: peptidoglycan DD-metalloendopeptidase family protein [Erysipelotrichaceae bacterium]|nr:peptidoglycan DD-metalloendopeptidase family protein [Erysipelotrichaceae bacterium]
MMKKILNVILCICMMFTWAGVQAFADDSDFASNYDYYYNMCSQRGLTEEQKTVCKEFRKYVDSQQSSLKSEVNSLNAQLNDLKSKINTEYKKIQEINNKISAVEKQIKTIEASIATTEANIKQVEEEIAAREARIEELNNGIKNRMALNQSNISSNNYIRFIMGASSFVELLRRVSALNEITEYDIERIEEMEAEKAQLELDKQELEEQKRTLEEQQESLKSYRSSLDSLKKAAEELVAAYHASSEVIGAQLAQSKTDLSELEAQITNIDKALDNFTPSEGWISPLRASFRVTSAFPYYEPGRPSSGFHPAADLGVNLGSNLYAVGNGYIVKTRGGCGYGYIGSTCNGGFGNYICYIIQVDDKIYEIICAHLSKISVSVGDYVRQGNVIGQTGSSGSSSGPHLHIETIYMGKADSLGGIKGAVRKYLNVGYVYYTLGRNVYWTCSYRGAPCYDSPHNIFGIVYGRRYN